MPAAEGFELASNGARPDLEAVVARADAMLGPRAVVFAAGPPALVESIEDLCGPREVVRMTWSR